MIYNQKMIKFIFALFLLIISMVIFISIGCSLEKKGETFTGEINNVELIVLGNKFGDIVFKLKEFPKHQFNILHSDAFKFGIVSKKISHNENPGELYMELSKIKGWKVKVIGEERKGFYLVKTFHKQ